MDVCTEDQWQAAWLLANGVSLIKATEGRYKVYIFDNGDGRAARLMERWAKDDTQINARALLTAYRKVIKIGRWR